MTELKRLWKKFFVPIGRWIAQRPRAEIQLACLVSTLGVGLADYLSGSEISLGVVYGVPISLAAWFVGPVLAVELSLLSVAIWELGDLALGAQFSDDLVPLANGVLRFVFYAFLSLVLARLNHLQRNLESRAEERARALAKEISERERLEREMLEISEREQRRIGQDLHDGLCQHLTGTAITLHVLAEALSHQEPALSDQARKVVNLVEEAISLARAIAKGLHPVELQADGLMQALEEFTATTSELFGIDCHFECPLPVLIHDLPTATHLYRIAQQAVSNAIQHGHATRIDVVLEDLESGIRLAVSDNGEGLPTPPPSEGGMGLRIMADRAKMIGGRFSVCAGAARGTELVCLIPQPAGLQSSLALA